MNDYKSPWGCWSAGLQRDAEAENEHWENDRQKRAELDTETPTLPEIKKALPSDLAKARYSPKLSTSLRKGVSHAFAYVSPAHGRMFQPAELEAVAESLGTTLEYDSAAFGFPVRYTKRGVTS